MSVTRYQVRIVQDDDRESPIVEAIPLGVWNSDFEAATDAASMILRGYVMEAQNDLRCHLDERSTDVEFHAEFTARSETWVQRAFATLTVAEAEKGDPVAWDT